MKFNFLQKQTSRREMLRGSAMLADSAFLAYLFAARLLRASAAGYAQEMPSDSLADGRRAPIHAEIVELYHAPSGEKVDVEGAIESGGRGRKTVEHTVIGAGAGALLGGIFGGGKGAGIGSVIGGAGGLGTTAFRGRQKITLSSGQELLIRVTGR